MTLETFFDKFDQFADAPDAVAKMREIILSMAIAGRLLSQNPSEEPALQQLKRIAVSKKQKGRVQKKTKNVTSSALSSLSGDSLPCGWAETTLEEVLTVLNGRAYKKSELLESGTPVLRVGNLFTSKHWYYSDLELEDDKYCEPGDLIYAWSASFGPFIWSGPKSIYHYHIWKLELHDEQEISKQFLFWFLQERTQAIKKAGRGLAMLHMTKGRMEKLAVPLPPLAEQKRIVAKVDELMALCDRLEAQQQERDTRHAALARASLARFAEAPTPANLHHLFHPSYTIPPADLRKSILTLAVQGKLVPSMGDTKVLPLGEILAEPSSNGVSKGPTSDTTATEVLRISAGTSREDFYVNEEDFKHVSLSPQEIEKAKLRSGDLLACRYNGNLHYVGMFSLYRGESGRIQVNPDKLIRFRVDTSRHDPRYVCLSMNSAPTREPIEAMCATTAGNIGLSAGRIKTVSIPLPPLAEQRRIVAKVDQLMALVDELETQLAASRATAKNLLQALVAELTS